MPLSNSRGLNKVKGARFRAALGISEEIDAIVILTSEESGKIYIFYDGVISETKPEELEKNLEFYLPSKKDDLTLYEKKLKDEFNKP